MKYFNGALNSKWMGKDSKFFYGMGWKELRYGVHRIIPNIYSSELMYALIFNHDEVKIKIDGNEVLVPANTAYLWDISKDVFYGAPKSSWHISWVQFMPLMMEDILKRIHVPLNTPVKFSGEGVLGKHFNMLREELCKYITPDSDMLHIISYAIMLECRRAFEKKDETIIHIPKEFEDIYEYVNKNFRSKLTLKKLAAKINLNPSYFSRRFKEYFGIAPIDYVLELKMNEALKYLRETTLSIKEIAAFTGYDSLYHFSKMFKKYHGGSPRKFRDL